MLGPGAAGKSTFSRRLGDLTGVPVTELDSVFWSNDLQPLSKQDWVDVQAGLTEPAAWILDGDLGPYDVLDTRLVRADTVVMFDPPLRRCVWRALRRSREQREFWVWLLTWRRCEKQRLLDAVALHAPDARFELITDDPQVESLLTALA